MRRDYAAPLCLALPGKGHLQDLYRRQANKASTLLRHPANFRDVAVGHRGWHSHLRDSFLDAAHRELTFSSAAAVCATTLFDLAMSAIAI
jgi:hypothetical protein